MKRIALLLAAILVGLLVLAGPAAAQVTVADSPGDGVIDTSDERDGGKLPSDDEVGSVVTTTGDDAAVLSTGLAQTGLNVTVGAALALGLAAGGVLLLVVTRRRSAGLGRA